MQSTIPIDVVISDELRRILAGGETAQAPRLNTAAAPQSGPPARRRPPVWSPLKFEHQLLQRDGLRPMRFKGMKLMEFCGETDLAGQTYFQSIGLFISDAQDLMLALHLKVPFSHAARSIHRAFDLTNENSKCIMTNWCNDVANVANTCRQQDETAIHGSAVSETLQDISDHSFRPDALITERTD